MISANSIFPQSAVIPFRVHEGNLEVLLITARGGNRWIVPKGLIENGMSAMESAAQEAYEEAGIRGKVFDHSVGEYEYEKWDGTCRVQIFLMHVQKVSDKWPEDDFRTRKWVSPESASETVNEPALKKLLADLPKLVEANPSTRTMNAYVLRKTGKPNVLQISEIDAPTPAAGEVQVRLQCVGINYAEILSRKGLYGWAPKRPYVLGMEGAGVIERAGDGVDKSRIGERVIVGTQFGCYAERVVVPQEQALPAVGHFSIEENAAFAVNYMTAWVALFELARLQKTETLLITAAAGGVGTAAIQLAAKKGCRVFGLAGGDEKIALVKKLGATGAFNYRSDDAFQRLREVSGGVDVALEMVGGNIFKESFNLLNPFGRLVVTGFASLNLNWWNPFSIWRTWRDLPRANVMKLAEKSVGVMASHLGHLLDEPQRLHAIFDELRRFVTDTQIRPIIGRVFRFEQAVEAHAFIESRKSMGKVLLRIGSE